VRLSYLALLLSLCWAGRGEAQLNVLTLREAESLVELIPDVVTSQQRAECPNVSPGYAEGTELEFRVRTTCGSGSGMLIGAYTVNRWTGAIKTWGDNPQPVGDNQGSALAAQLVQQARKRILSTSEAQCLARTAARAIPGWSAGDAVIAVDPLSKPGTPSAKSEAREGITHFAANHTSSSSRVESGRLLTVYLDEARVRDDETGADLLSAAVGDLSAKLVGLRAPVWLSDEEAASVALAVPQVAANLREGCTLNTGGAFYSHEALIGASCKDGLIRDSNVLVNLETGSVTDPRTRKSLDTREAQRIARQLLSDAQKRRTNLQEAVQLVCQAQ